jgi:acetyl/propionyl-CoA carboxylase alpha subunit
MKLELKIDDVDQPIELLRNGPDCRFRLGDGPERAAQVETPEPGMYSVLLDGLSYDTSVEETLTGLVVVVDGHRFEIEVRDPRRWTRGSGAAGAEGLQTVLAPMPGKIVRVLIAPGDAVETGQGLIVVEAMKMQNEMKAARAGRVLSVAVKEGTTVSAGQILATIE